MIMAQMQKREKILLAITGVAALVFLFNYFVCGKQKAPTPQIANKVVTEITGPGQPVAAGVKSSNQVKESDLSNRINLNTWGRDPFAETYRLTYYDVTKNDSSNYVLRGIIRKGDEAHVLIGDEIFKSGEKIGDLKVLDIEDDRVVCKIRGRVVTLLLNENEIFKIN